MKQFYIITKWTLETTVLNLEPETYDKCRNSIAWQLQGGFTEPHFICTYDKAKKEFFCADTQSSFAPSKGCYTQAAWDKFQAILEAQPCA